MRFLVIYCVFLLAAHPVFAQALYETSEGRAFIKTVGLATGNSETPEEATPEAHFQAKQQLVAMGPKLNELVTQLLLETIKFDRTDCINQTAISAGVHPHGLLWYASFDPESTSKLLPMLLQWADAAANERYTNFFTLAQNAAAYICRRGTDADRARLRADVEKMLKSTNSGVLHSGTEARRALEGDVPPYGPYIRLPLFEWCKKRIKEGKDKAEETTVVLKVSEPWVMPAIVKSPTSRIPLPIDPADLRENFISIFWMALVGLAGVLIMWRMRRFNANKAEGKRKG